MITRRTPITGNGRGKRRCLRASNRRPLAIMSALRAPDSWPLTFRSEISQGIARRCVGNFCVDQREESARLAEWRASSDDQAAHRFCLKRQRSKSPWQALPRALAAVCGLLSRDTPPERLALSGLLEDRLV